MNPFIELYQHPVASLIALGYSLGLACLVFLTLAACYRNALRVKQSWDHRGPRTWEYVPPAGWLLRVAAIPAILAVDAWAIAALIWLVF